MWEKEGKWNRILTSMRSKCTSFMTTMVDNNHIAKNGYHSPFPLPLSMSPAERCIPWVKKFVQGTMVETRPYRPRLLSSGVRLPSPLVYKGNETSNPCIRIPDGATAVASGARMVRNYRHRWTCLRCIVEVWMVESSRNRCMESRSSVL